MDKEKSQKLSMYMEEDIICEMLLDGALEYDFDDEIAVLPTNSQRFERLYDYLNPYYDAHCEDDHDGKCDESSQIFREEADELYNDGAMEDALLRYTKAIASAETKLAKSLSYYRRGDILLDWGMLDIFKVDKQRAIDNNYPEYLLPFLYEKLEKSKSYMPLKEEYHSTVPIIKETQRNKYIQSAANSIKMETNKMFGRHIIATRDINIGEIIMVEKPFVAAIGDEDYSHCYECCVLCYNPIPCDICTQVLYCSEDCKRKAQDFHYYECIIRRKIGGASLDAKNLIALKLTYLMRNRYESNNFESNDKVYRSDRYHEIYNLEHSLDYLRSYALVKALLYKTAFIYHILKNHSDYFDVANSEIAEKEFKRLLVLNRAIVEKHYTLIPETVKVLGGSCGITFIGCGIYPAMRLFNHACSHNISSVAFGTTIASYASRTIKKGEQCFFNYGIRYEDFSKAQRQDGILKNYHFQCTCQACVEDWPSTTQRGFDNGKNEFAHRLFHSIDMQFIRNNLKACVKFLKTAEKTAPSEDFIIAFQLFEFCLRSFGNVRPISTTFTRIYGDFRTF